jgi:N-terminal acetyltransferase B complex non-catalytic subunit
MAAREVTERRLRPVYDAIDNGQFKKAVQLADKIMKKQNDLVCAKALKALALHRMGKTIESEQIAEDVKKSEPSDDPTLQAMTLYYRETNQRTCFASCVCELLAIRDIVLAVCS